ncbi:hypothetical protein ACFQ0M_47795 [Kitasatospora aburaviensis]|uniref:Uncharacterized protein n=1 Tax=Kitasatospora aburaviensis TaxID=67265 RepID=A0ABW1F0S7_9ACTN
MGDTFDVIRVLNQRLGQTALEDLRRNEVPVGPVLLNRPRRAVEFLIPFVRGLEWDIRDTERITRRPEEALPRVKMPIPGPLTVDGRSWLVAPDGGQILTTPAHLATAIRRARRTLRDAPAVAGRHLSPIT